MLYKLKILVGSEPWPHQQFIPNELLTDIGEYGEMATVRTFNMDPADMAMLKLRHPNLDRFISESPDV